MPQLIGNAIYLQVNRNGNDAVRCCIQAHNRFIQSNAILFFCAGSTLFLTVLVMKGKPKVTHRTVDRQLVSTNIDPCVRQKAALLRRRRTDRACFVERCALFGGPSLTHFCFACRFRSCLKVANSGAANLVGKIYFNVVETKCFMFQMEEVCNERSWWGSCLSSKRRKRAVFREPMTY